ncbi:common pilus major fimbrillin subunit EcpA [Yersinia mollaretii]|uniref:common pilus major fimbrillin subunit EcpA n=1 Tax=Yersinia mollaretii TaxID=33060 RepID=UPI0011AA1157|nr:common pilus major fimbrillin subunit EcpA [Yersinia mollaretii]
MKNTVIIAAIVSAFVAIPAAQAVNVTDHATVTWGVSAKKTSTASLAVVADNGGEVEFNFDPVTNKFGMEKSFIDVTIGGDGSSSAFKLVATLGNKILTHDDGANISTLTVGMLYNLYEATTPTAGSTFTLLNSTDSQSVLNDAMKHLINGTTNPRFKRETKSNGADILFFRIESGTANGTAVPNLYNLPNGNWSGDVTVNFTATWTVPV